MLQVRIFPQLSHHFSQFSKHTDEILATIYVFDVVLYLTAACEWTYYMI